MAFVFSKSTPLTGYVAMYEFKELLKSAGWVVKSSGTGTAGSVNLTADMISSSALMSGAKAWFRIQSPDTLREYTFQTVSVATDWRVKYSFAAKFIASVPTKDVTPSATDEFVLLGTGTDAAPSANTFFTTDNIYRWNVCADNASPYGFWAGAFTNGGATVVGVLIDEPLTATHPSDAHTHLIIMRAAGWGDLTSAYVAIANSQLSAYYNESTVPAATPTTMVHFSGLYPCSQGGTIFPNTIATNPIDSKDESMPICYARSALLTSPCWKGIGTLMRWNGTSRSIGSTLTISSAKDRIVYNHVNLPWDGSVPTV
jgi:hypothetical protein